MSEILIGIVIGGILSGLGTWVATIIQQKRWGIETQIERLSAKRERLEIAYERTLKELSDCMAKNVYSAHMASNIDLLFPEAVSRAFNELVKDKDKSELSKKHHYFNITYAMKNSLKNIDDQIDELILGKSYTAVMKDALPKAIKKPLAK